MEVYLLIKIIGLNLMRKSLQSKTHNVKTNKFFQIKKNFFMKRLKICISIVHGVRMRFNDMIF